MSLRGICIVAAKRTPFGAMAGGLKSVSATDLGVAASKGALAQGNIDPASVDEVIFGNVCQSSPDAIYLARHVGLKAGAPVAAPALTVNRLCGSGFEAVVLGAKQILRGESDVVLVGGSENMSQCPHSIYGAREGSGLQLGKAKLVDSLWEGLTDSYAGVPMGLTAENLAEQYKITQEEVDEYAVRSQQLFGEAQKAGRISDELVPVELKVRGKVKEVAVDEHGRPDVTTASFAKLPKVFKKDGVVHPGAASGICDGAAALILTSEENAAKQGWTPLARLVSHGVAGCDPKIMGIGPVPATKKALQAADMSLDQIGLVEVNEAFAPQVCLLGIGM